MQGLAQGALLPGLALGGLAGTGRHEGCVLVLLGIDFIWKGSVIIFSCCAFFRMADAHAG